MLSYLRKAKESGFTLIEILTVIIIIGVLAAIAIPVFSAQRSRAQDSRTVSDIRNIVTATETYLVDRTKSAADITGKSVLEFASSPNVQWEIKGNSVTNGYCVVAFNTSGKDYNSSSKLLSYDSTAGGLKGSNGSCGPRTNGDMVAGAMRTDTGFTAVGTPAANTLGSTAVGSSTAVPIDATPVPFSPTNNSGPSGTMQTFTVPATGTYKIEAWGSQGGTSGMSVGGSGAYATGTVSLTKDQVVNIIVGQMGLTASGNGGWETGGGGGSYVVDSRLTSTRADDVALVVAGGGGGATSGAGGGTITGYSGTTNSSGGTGTSPTTDYGTPGTGGTNGGGGGGACGSGGAGFGNGNNSSASGGAAGRAGYAGSSDGNGGQGCSNNAGGSSYLNGSSGGNGNAAGGFGGGGSAPGFFGSGGGGGYSGGGGTYHRDTSGGGGGSYVIASATAQEINNVSKAKTGAGRVVITRVS